jgi:hypothetical protein
LGIDIGNIDVALLIGAPGSTSAFIQRIGRANRRQSSVHAACFFRTPLEYLLFQALAGKQQHHSAPVSFRPSVAIQQIFSLLKQSPSAALRLKPLIEIFSGMLTPADIESILTHLKTAGYLADGRMGEWRPGKHLHRLADLQGVEDAPLSLYSNIQTSEATKLKIRDQQSQRVVARVDRQWLDRDILTLEGRPLQVTWFDGEALWVGAHYGSDPAMPMRHLSTRQLLSFELAQQLPAHLGLAPGVAPLLPCDDGWLLFHWLGDVYGQALLDLLRYTVRAEASSQPGLCVLLREEPRGLRALPAGKVQRYLRDEEARFENMLALGAYHHLLPRILRQRAIIEQFNVPRFVEAVANLRAIHAPDTLTEELPGLLAS